MKFDNVEIKQYESVEQAPIERKIKRKHRIGAIDFAIVQLVLCVAISAIVLTAQVVTTVSASKQNGSGTTAYETMQSAYMY